MSLAADIRNPILVREVDHRMRDNRTYFIPMVYLFVLGLVTIGAYLLMMQEGMGRGMVMGWIVGKVIFHVVAFTQMGLIILLVPSVSAGAITGERDRGTLALLLVTPMPRRRIVLGKLLSSVLYILLLVSTSIPLAGLSFGFGGTDLKLLLVTYGCIMLAALSIASMGLMVSTVMKRTVPAVLLAYGLVAAIAVGGWVAEIPLHIAYPKFESVVFAYANPFTPLIINVFDYAEVEKAHVFWWITPAFQALVTVVCTAIAWRRIGRMRE